jgi:BolA protein
MMPTPDSQTRPHVTAAAVEAALRAELAPISLQVSDDSAAHAGHAGAREGSHLSVQIVSERFAGQARVARHRLVYHALRSLMPQGIHALAIDARAPGEDR